MSTTSSHSRHARFNENPVSGFQSPPSPASSVSSVDSGPLGPSTPPPLESPHYSPLSLQQMSPYPSPPQPQVYTPSPVYHPQLLSPSVVPSPQITPVHLHPALQNNMRFNAAYPPMMNNPPLPQSVLAAPAVHPPTREMMLQSKFLPWVVRVVAEGPFVTVADVLAALYRELRHRITKREWEAAGSSRSVQRAYEARCEVDPSERPKGIKRIDFLLGQTVVEALVRTKDGTWHIESHA